MTDGYSWSLMDWFWFASYPNPGLFIAIGRVLDVLDLTEARSAWKDDIRMQQRDGKNEEWNGKELVTW